MPGINGACDVPHAAWLRSSLVALCSAVAACVIGDQPSYMCIMSGRRWRVDVGRTCLWFGNTRTS